MRFSANPHESEPRVHLNTIAAKILTPGLRKFSNRHKGQSCYIFGDGPSIKWFDLARFNDRPAICCGMIPFHNDFRKLDVRYIMLLTPWMFAPRRVQPAMYHPYRKLYAEYAKLIRTANDRDFFISLSNRFSLSGANVNYVFRGFPRSESQTDKELGGFDLYAGSFHATLALAYFLGFSRIYLIGFDAWVSQSGMTGRWYELGTGDTVSTAGAAADYLKVLSRDIELYSISAGGTSQYIRHVDYETYTGKLPVFRENHELMDRRYLDILASCPGYRIFN